MDVNPFMVRGACCSIALSHPENCNCYICKAAAGDEAAFARVLEDLDYIMTEEPNDSDRVLN